MTSPPPPLVHLQSTRWARMKIDLANSCFLYAWDLGVLYIVKAEIQLLAVRPLGDP